MRRLLICGGSLRLIVLIAAIPFLFSLDPAWGSSNQGISGEAPMKLPKPRYDGPVSLEQAIKHRRTVRSFSTTPLSLRECSQLLWAAQGITDDRGALRAAPSAGALYPLDIYLVTGIKSIAGLDAGVYHYEPFTHGLSPVSKGDIRRDVARAALRQNWMADAPVQFVITAEYGRSSRKYGERGIRYAMIEAGHIGENIFLQAEALGLSAGIAGAFHDARIIEILRIPLSHNPLIIMPVGHRK